MNSEMPVIPTPTPAPEKKLSVLSLVSTISGALTYLLPFLADKNSLWVIFLSPITAIVAIVTGHKGKGEIRKAMGNITGKKLANAGLIMGYVYFGLIALGIVLVIVLGVAVIGMIKSSFGL